MPQERTQQHGMAKLAVESAGRALLQGMVSIQRAEGKDAMGDPPSSGMSPGDADNRPTADGHRLPELEGVHANKTATLKHVPKFVRDTWVVALACSLALAVHENSEAAWTELAMLPKRVLCPPPRAGKAHAKAAATFAHDRLARQLPGEDFSIGRTC